MLPFRLAIRQHANLSANLLRASHRPTTVFPASHSLFTARKTSDATIYRRIDHDQTLNERIYELIRQAKADPDLAHGIPELPPPYRLHDLHRLELAAYVLHGPKYMSSNDLDRRQRKKCARQIQKRADQAIKCKERLGPDWYTIMAAARELRNEAYLSHQLSTETKSCSDDVTLQSSGASLREDLELRYTDEARKERMRIRNEWRRGEGNLDKFIERARKGERADPRSFMTKEEGVTS